jgi:nucleoside 2-deoxyribosyltransferase
VDAVSALRLPHDLPPGAVYVASATSERAEAAFVATQLRAAGRHVTSSWHDVPLAIGRQLEHHLDTTRKAEIAASCLAEIDACDVLLALGHRTMRGALWECGYAMGLGRKVVWVGDDSVSLFSALTTRGAW